MNNWQKFAMYCREKGFFYAIYRGAKYLKWKLRCFRMGIDYRQFRQNK